MDMTEAETPTCGDGDVTVDLSKRINMDLRGYAMNDPSFQLHSIRHVFELFTKPNMLFEKVNATPENRRDSTTSVGKMWLRQEFPAQNFPTGYASHDRKADPTWGPDAMQGPNSRVIRHLMYDENKTPLVSVTRWLFLPRQTVINFIHYAPSFFNKDDRNGVIQGKVTFLNPWRFEGTTSDPRSPDSIKDRCVISEEQIAAGRTTFTGAVLQLDPLDQSFADQGTRFDWNQYFRVIELLAGTPEWLHGPFEGFQLPADGLLMWQEGDERKFIMELPVITPPQWNNAKNRVQTGRFEAILFAPDLLKVMLRLEALLRYLFPGAVVERMPKRDQHPHHAVMWHLKLTVGYLKDGGVPLIGKTWVRRNELQETSTMTIGVTAHHHASYSTKARVYIEGGQYSVAGTRYPFLPFVARVLFTEILQRIFSIDTRPEVLIHRVAGPPRYRGMPPPLVINKDFIIRQSAGCAGIIQYMSLGEFYRYSLTGDRPADLRLNAEHRRLAVMPRIWQESFATPGSEQARYRSPAWTADHEERYYVVQPPALSGFDRLPTGRFECVALQKVMDDFLITQDPKKALYCDPAFYDRLCEDILRGTNVTGENKFHTKVIRAPIEAGDPGKKVAFQTEIAVAKFPDKQALQTNDPEDTPAPGDVTATGQRVIPPAAAVPAVDLRPMRIHQRGSDRWQSDTDRVIEQQYHATGVRAPLPECYFENEERNARQKKRMDNRAGYWELVTADQLQRHAEPINAQPPGARYTTGWHIINDESKESVIFQLITNNLGQAVADGFEMPFVLADDQQEFYFEFGYREGRLLEDGTPEWPGLANGQRLLGFQQRTFARERQSCADLGEACNCVHCRTDFIDLDTVIQAVERRYVFVKVSVSADPDTQLLTLEQDPHRVIRTLKRDDSEVRGGFFRINTPIGSPRSVPASECSFVTATNQSSRGSEFTVGEAERDADGNVIQHFWHHGGRAKDPKQGQTRGVRYRKRRRAGHQKYCYSDQDGNPTGMAPARRRYCGAFEFDPSRPEKHQYRPPGTRDGKIKYVLPQAVIDDTELAFDSAPLPPERVTEVRRHANEAMTAEMNAQDGSDRRRVDLDGRRHFTERYSTREVMRARGQYSGYADGQRQNQTADRKTFLQSVCQAHERGNGLSARMAPELFGRAHYKKENWFCWDFNNVHPNGCRCRKCRDDERDGRPGHFWQQNGINCQRGGYQCVMRHICNFCVCPDKDEWTWLHTGDPMQSDDGYWVLKGCSQTERLVKGHLLRCCDDRTKCNGAFISHIWNPATNSGRALW